jgi:hypothetical protein
MFRDLLIDERKSKHDRLKILKQGLCCTMPGCTELLTLFKGPGNDLFCRDHQIEQIQYGGYGRAGREHTFHRSDVCECCGQDINNDPRWAKCKEKFGDIDARQQHEVKRRYNHGDHEHRKADGGDNSASNTNAYCSFCHWYKTVKNNDGRRAEIS